MGSPRRNCWTGRRASRDGAIALGLLLWAVPALAHPLDVGALTVRVRGTQVQATLDLSADMARQAVDAQRSPAPGAPVPAWPDAGLDAEALARATLTSGVLLRGATVCALVASPRFANLDADAGLERRAVAASADCATEAGGGGGPLRWTFPFLGRMPFSFRLLVRVDTARGAEESILSAGHDALDIAAPEAEPARHFGQFVLMGMQHIGATPGEWQGPHGLRLPDGIDHILFLVALLLTGVQLVPVLKTVTGFTVGHSITLSLATLGWVQLPGRLVESAIALSIAFVAAEDLWIKTPRSRWQLAAAFGLVHGFGFARALAELKLDRGQLASALFGFNVGVELGQELLVLLLAPGLWLLFRQAWFRRYGRPACALAILGLALVWFVQRAFG